MKSWSQKLGNDRKGKVVDMLPFMLVLRIIWTQISSINVPLKTLTHKDIMHRSLPYLIIDAINLHINATNHL